MRYKDATLTSKIEQIRRFYAVGKAAAAALTGGAGGVAVEVAGRVFGQRVVEWVVERTAAHKREILALPFLALAAVVFLVVAVSVAVVLPFTDGEKGFRGGSPSPYALAEIPPDYLQIFLAAEQKYGVAWNVLAAICKVESGFGRSQYWLSRNGVSPAGAVGIMQFMPTTWSGSRNPFARDDPRDPQYDTDPERIAKYGGYGVDANGDGRADPYDPWDAVFAAAKYLAANGFKENPRQAIYQYNHAWWYVDRVMELALKYAPETLPSGDARCLPVPKEFFVITSRFGWREDPVKGGPEFHRGIDIAAPAGTPVFATDDGVVESAGWDDGFGLEVVVNHGTYKTQYAHLSAVAVRAGDRVKAGQPVGAVGSTGRSTGPHLHFGVVVNGNFVDPEPYLSGRKAGS
ncbi:peptidoglycan DD-metalloendopeptidase family protein [Ammonifex thiophilus]|uniref:Peptidase M23 n=1 Tax=Ammonifex thiophilus TaxID=444093 RepID=A0A3D8P2N4_9THEO|nr:peptidoglycan DD-metalloendopeptidase family protein [Ammonifex thiophilus]RDV80496.1 peptidase M23 [Ammonifex thiophilus]